MNIWTVLHWASLNLQMFFLNRMWGHLSLNTVIISFSTSAVVVVSPMIRDADCFKVPPLLVLRSASYLHLKKGYFLLQIG